MATVITFDRKNPTRYVSSDWPAPAKNAYRCHIALVEEDDGSFSAIVLNLPGAGSCGKTREEALANVEEAIRGVIESYETDGQEIPWQDSDLDGVPAGAERTWILVNA